MTQHDEQQTHLAGPLIHDALAAHAARTPDALAIVGAAESLTYAELDARSNQLARALIDLGARPDSRVAICTSRTPAMFVALFGVLKSGASYIPIDPTFPKSRIEIMLEDGEPFAVISEQALLDRLPTSVEVLSLDAPDAVWQANDPTAPDVDNSPDSLAYTIFRSGSTGRPKGVQIEHRNVVNLMESMAAEPGFGPDDTILAMTTISFDMSVPELFLAPSVGGTIQLVTREVATDAFELLKLIDRVKPSTFQGTPATFQMLLAAGWEGQPGLKALCGGEAMPRPLAERLVGIGVDLWNMYGPTETTVWSSVHHVLDTDGQIPLGHPVNDTQLYVLDESLAVAPPGEIGELVIGGGGVARGYLGRPELTAEKFIPDHLGPIDGRRLYRTGDLARWQADGSLEFLGRNDHQIKLRGYRIELPDIETALLARDGIGLAAVVLRHSEAGDAYLAGFYSSGQPGVAPPSRTEVRAHLRDNLPEYMVPAYLVGLDEMPLTPTNKVDRLNLPEIDLAADVLDHDVVEPRTDLERILVDAFVAALDIPRAGIHDDFFDLGGNSLLAVRLFAELEGGIETELRLADLVEASTAAELAVVIEERGSELIEYHPLVPMAEGDPSASRPLYVVHGAGGNVLGFTETVRSLPADLPVVGVQARGTDGRSVPHETIDDMVAAYCDAVLEDSDGPYRLAGYSGGGVLAFEMARLLRARGGQVESLIMIDTLPPTAQARRLGPRDRIADIRAFGLVESVRRLVARRRAAAAMARRIDRAARHPSGASGGALPYQLREARLVAAFDRAVLQYTPTRISGRIDFLQAAEIWVTYDHVDSVGFWSRLCEELKVHSVPGDHHTLVDAVNRQALAAALVAALEHSESTSA